MIGSGSIKKEERISKLLIHAVLLAGALSMLAPFLWMIITSFKTPSEAIDKNIFMPSGLFVEASTNKNKEWPVFDLIATDGTVIKTETHYLTAIKEKYAGKIPGQFKEKNFSDTALTDNMRVELRGRKNSEGVLIADQVIYYSSAIPDEALPKKGAFGTISSIKMISHGFFGGIKAWFATVFRNYIRTWNSGKVDFGRCFFNSFYVALLCTVGQLISCSLAAFAFSHMRFPGKDIFFAVMLASMMCPPQVLLIPNYMLLMKLGWINTYYALIIPWMASFFGIFLLRQFFMTMPRDLWDAARIDGCSRFMFFRKILIPLSLAPLTTIAVFTFVGNFNSFFWPLIVTNDKSLATIQVGLSMFNSSEGTQWDLLMAASTLAILPLLIGFFFAQKQFIQGMAHTGSKE
jgi:multiple sugar transport system permease protein